MKTVTIEELLSWAFVHELPKGGGIDGLDNINSAWRMLDASSWGKIARFGELGTLIDSGAHGGGMFIEQGEPHPDALAVGRAVLDLGGLTVVIPDEWSPLEDWELDQEGHVARLAAEASAAAARQFMHRTPARRSAHVISLIVSHAILGRAPDRTAEQPKIRMVSRNGRPAWFIMKTFRDDLGGNHAREVNGYNDRAQRPLRGAYRKFEFSDNPSPGILARLDWQLWVSGLASMMRALTVGLESHRLLPFSGAPSPWSASATCSATLVRPVVHSGSRKKMSAAC